MREIYQRHIVDIPRINGDKASDIKRLKELVSDNRRLKQLFDADRDMVLLRAKNTMKNILTWKLICFTKSLAKKNNDIAHFE